MSIKLRLTRVGKKNRPLFRICAIETSRARDGKYIENLGFYDPLIADNQNKVRLNKERAEYWLSVGARPSNTVFQFLKAAEVSGLIRQKPRRKRRRKKESRATATAGAGVQAPGAAGAKGGTKARKPPKKPKAQGEAAGGGEKGGGPSS